MCFDLSGRRLITGSRDRTIKMWNFNNGQILRQMIKGSTHETTDLCYIEMGSSQYIIAVGWDRRVTIFLEDNSCFLCEPIRILDGSGSKNSPG